MDFSEGVFRRSRDLLEGTLCVFAPLCQYEEKITVVWRHLSIIRDCLKSGNSVREITPH